MPVPAILLSFGLSTMLLIAVEAPTHLRCEFLENPLGMDCLAPRLSWWLNGPRRQRVESDNGVVADRLFRGTKL